MDLTVAQFNAIDNVNHLPGKQIEQNDATEPVNNNEEARKFNQASDSLLELSDEDNMVIAMGHEQSDRFTRA